MIDGLWLALRFAGLVLALLAAGTALAQLLLAREVQALRVTWTGRVHRLARLALLVTLAQVLIELPHLQGSWDAFTDGSSWRVLPRSAATLTLGLRIAGLCILLARGLAPLALGVLLVCGSFIASGHTVTAAHRAALALALGLHVLAAAFWLGGLALLHGVLARHDPRALVPLLRRFSRQAVILVPLLGLAGILLAMRLLSGLSALRTGYGSLLILKGVVFCALLLLAALNRNRLLPRLAQGDAGAGTTLRRTVAVELLLVGTVLAATALLSGWFSPD
jgi:putative copper export protein